MGTCMSLAGFSHLISRCLLSQKKVNDPYTISRKRPGHAYHPEVKHLSHEHLR